jgi:F0F1-type ATP synthase assembly protein I
MKNPSLDIIVTEHCSTGGCPLEEACEHCYLIQSAISVAISYIISVYCEDYAGYFTVILSFLAFHLCSAYFIYLVSCSIKEAANCFNIFYRGRVCRCYLSILSSCVAEKNIERYVTYRK